MLGCWYRKLAAGQHQLVWQGKLLRKNTLGVSNSQQWAIHLPTRLLYWLLHAMGHHTC